MSKIDSITHKAHKLHQQGKFSKAEKLYRKALKLSPNNFDVLQSMGAIALQNKNYPQAIKFLESAFDLQPEIPGLLSNLGIAHKNSGHKKKAWYFFERTINIDNNFGPAFYNLALLQIDNGNLEQALITLNEAERCRPGHIPTLSEMAQTLARTGHLNEAINYFRHALHLDPESKSNSEPNSKSNKAQLLFGLGTTHQLNQQYQEAINIFREAISCQTDFHDARSKLADTLESINQTDEAWAEAEKVLSSNPNHPAGNLILARLERRKGELSNAKQRLQKILGIIEGSIENNDINAGIFTELGITLDRLGEYDSAFYAFEKANQIMADLPSTQAISTNQVYRVIENNRDWINQRNKSPDPTERDKYLSPIFLAGFPRSGTTLTEQILATHDKVTTGDELPVLNHMTISLSSILGKNTEYPVCLDSLDEDDVNKLRQYYWTQMTTALGDNIFDGIFIDKMPLNIIHLGLVERIFPDARVIVALRDPRDVCLSCFMQLFHLNESMVQFLDITSTTKYYAEVMGLWLKYRDKLKLRWIESRYEDIVSDFDQSTHKLSEFLGLDENKSMANFHQQAANRAISTPSYQDVSTPIYQRAMGRWQHYQKHLEPAINELAPYIKAFGYAP